MLVLNKDRIHMTRIPETNRDRGHQSLLNVVHYDNDSRSY